jgi:predicted DsbA family dithiol-disulfide isomerase
MTKKLHITMVHDIVCSWCPIGYNNIKTAIENLKFEVEFHFIPFQLNPNMDENGESISSYFKRQFGWNEVKLHSYQHSLVKTAANAGISIDFSKRTHYYNTHNAHLLMRWAERFNKQKLLNECLIKAYFNDGLDISNLTVLLNIAEAVGLDKRQANIALTSSVFNKKLKQELTKKIQRYQAFNISNIPSFIINNNELLSGSNSVGYFENLLSKQSKTAYVEHN